jgi:hypothetical protein
MSPVKQFQHTRSSERALARVHVQVPPGGWFAQVSP